MQPDFARFGYVNVKRRLLLAINRAISNLAGLSTRPIRIRPRISRPKPLDLFMTVDI